MSEMKLQPISMIRKSYLTVIVIVAFFTLFGMGFFWLGLFVVSQSFKEMKPQIGTIQTCLLIAMPAIAAIVIAALFYACRKRVKLVSETEPEQYTVEDFLITSRVRDNKRNYTLHPVLKNPNSGELICAFGKYNRSVYSVVRAQNGNTPIYASIVRRDGSPVEIGDTVWVYIKDFADVKASAKDETSYSVGKETHAFNNINREYGVTVLNSLRIFEGLIDVERYEE